MNERLERIKNFIKNINKKYLLIFISIFILLFIILIVFNINTERSRIIQEEKPINTQIKEDGMHVLDTINNIKYVKTGKIDSQIKFLSKQKNEKNENQIKDLLTVSLNSNFQNNQEINLKGDLSLDIKNIDMSLDFPFIINNFGTNGYEIFLDIPSEYKESFEMNLNQDYIYINKDNIIKIKKLYDIKPKNNRNSENNKEIDNIISKIEYKKIDSTSGIYDINLNNKDTLMLYNLITNENTSKSDKYKINNSIKKIMTVMLADNINDSENNINSFKGQIAVSKLDDKFVATDIYIEVENNDGYIIAFRFTINDINKKEVNVNTFKTEKTKDFYDFMSNLIDNEITKGTKTINEEQKITIGEIFFTGKDETLKKEQFNLKDFDSIINIFINFSECTKNSNITVKWFYNNLEVPIVENNLSNGDYEEGILKSSINFSDINSISLGNYIIKIYLENTEIKEVSFNISE